MMKTPFAIFFLYFLVVFNGLSTTIHEFQPDPRVAHWPLLKNYTPLIYIIACYLLFVLVGPKFMENRAPLKLRSMLKIYNFVQVVISGYMFKEFLLSAYHAGYDWRCQAADFSNSDTGMRMAAVCWWFFFSKIIDLFDTIFFILRKKNSQVSFLHVYHHSSMIWNWYFAAAYYPGGQIFFQCMINSFVHVVMYGYYFLSAFGPGIQKYLWWKRYITQLQLIQFATIIVHLIAGMTKEKCDIPSVINFYVIVYCVTLIALFTNFYIETYSQIRRNRENDKKIEEENQESLNCSKKRMKIVMRYPGVSEMINNNYSVL